MKSTIIVTIIVLLATNSDCYNILAVFPHPGRSHFDAFKQLLVGLSQKGHNLTVISHHRDGTEENLWRDVTLDGVVRKNIVDIGFFSGTMFGRMTDPLFLARAGRSSDDVALQTENLHTFLKENNTFDVVIVEYFNTYSFLGVVKKIKAPIIGLSTCEMMPWSYAWFGSSNHPAYIPNAFLGFSDKMTFLQRLQNTLTLFLHEAIFHLVMDKSGNEYSKKYLGEDLLEGGSIQYNTSLIFTNTHFSFNSPKALSPNIIEVGGLHLTTPQKLSSDLEKWINGSEHGVIYFSLGSMIKGHTLPEEKRKAFLNAFARLPQRVVWKWENETMPDKPHNVLIKKWMPQSDILAHPNIKAFISHGGLLGTIEAVNYGVPVVVMPQFGDQHTNAKALEKNGGGVILELADVTEETVYNALTTVLDPNFKKQAEELSARFRDRPLPPLETAIYWVEYVARHKGAHHMKTAAVGMPFYKYYLLDVFAFLTAVLAIHLYLAFVPIRFVVRKIRGCKKDAQKTKEKKQ